MIDIDQDTNNLINEIYLQTTNWQNKIEQMQQSTRMKGVKAQVLRLLIDKITDLQDFCIKN